MVLSSVLLGLAVLSLALNLWQWFAGRSFPMRTSGMKDFAPPLSVLKPLKLCDSTTEECLESWFLQDYGAEYELLFGVAFADDPVCEIVRSLTKKYPAQRAELIMCHPILGANAKVSSLHYLARKAQFEHLVISDQDVRVERSFLREIAQTLEDPSVGLVNCFYVYAGPRGLAMWLEAVAVNADFWTQVLQGIMIKPMDFALGAAMATRKTQLQQIAGFEPLLDYLADDYQLGNRIARTGARLEICRVPVECHSEAQEAVAIWKHQLRWARTIRVCQPAPYFFSILSNATLWPLLLFVKSGSVGSAYLFAGALVLRVVTAKSNYRRLTGQSGWKPGFLAPIKDILQVAIWALAFAGNKITWRDERFRVDKGGKLTPLARRTHT